MSEPVEEQSEAEQPLDEASVMRALRELQRLAAQLSESVAAPGVEQAGDPSESEGA